MSLPFVVEARSTKKRNIYAPHIVHYGVLDPQNFFNSQSAKIVHLENLVLYTVLHMCIFSSSLELYLSPPMTC